MASLNFTALESSLFSRKKQRSKEIKTLYNYIWDQILSGTPTKELNKPQEMVTQYACNKPASWPFNVKPSVAKKDLLRQSLEWYLHCVVLVTAREPRK